MTPPKSNFYLSSEVRWFLEGPFSEEIWDSFGRTSEYRDKIKPEQRTDKYLVFPNASNIGVKIREGKLEIKTFIDEINVYFPPGISGVAESWEKWSCNPQEKELFNRIPEDEPEIWLQVEKKRILRFWDDQGDEHPPGEHLEKGCEVEVAEIRFLDKIYRSIAFEAFGSGNIPITLEKTINTVFGENDPASLSKISNLLHEKRSISYPALFHGSRNPY